MKNIFILCLFWLPVSLPAQDIPLNKYGLPVVSSIALYQQQVKANAAMRLVKVDNMAIDVKYATPHNFTDTILYPFAAVWLRQPAYEALTRLQEFLAPHGPRHQDI